jgi:hypothetical protein
MVSHYTLFYKQHSLHPFFFFLGLPNSLKYFLRAFLVLETLLIAFFVVLEIRLFYLFFKSILILVFLIVGISGGRSILSQSLREGEFFIFHVLKAPHCERRNMDCISTSVGNTGLSQFCSNRPLISWRKISRRGVRRAAVAPSFYAFPVG